MPVFSYPDSRPIVNRIGSPANQFFGQECFNLSSAICNQRLTNPANPHCSRHSGFYSSRLPFFIAPCVYEIQQATLASAWIPKADRVTHAEVTRHGGGRAHDIPRYAIDMRGTFLETNKKFVVERIAFGQYSEPGQIHAIVSQYPPGSGIIVYSAPDDPSRVILTKRANIMPIVLLVFMGGACVLFPRMTYQKGKNLARMLGI